MTIIADSTPLIKSQKHSSNSFHNHHRNHDFFVDFANMFKAFLGINFLAVSYAFSNSGILIGTIGLIFIAIITNHCSKLLIDVKAQVTDELHPDTHVTLGEVARLVGGSFTERIVNWLLVIIQLGFCISYLIFFATTFKDVTHSTWKPYYLVLIPVPLLCILALLRSVRSLASYSILANFALLFGFVVVVTYMGFNFEYKQGHPKIQRLPLFLGQVSALMEGISLVIPIEQSMTHKKHFEKILSYSVSLLTAVLLTIGIMGYATYGDQTHSIILSNIQGSLVVDSVKALLCIGIVFTYPLQVVPVLHAVDSFLLQRSVDAANLIRSASFNSLLSDPQSDSASDQSKDSFDYGDADHHLEGSVFIKDKNLIIGRLAVILLSAAIAALVGAEFGLFQSLFGSFAGAIIGFSMPAYFHLRVYADHLDWKAKLKDVLLIIWGLCISIIGTYTAIKEIMAAAFF